LEFGKTKMQKRMQVNPRTRKRKSFKNEKRGNFRKTSWTGGRVSKRDWKSKGGKKQIGRKQKGGLKLKKTEEKWREGLNVALPRWGRSGYRERQTKN